MDRCSSLGHPDAMVGIKQNFLISDNKGIFKITLYLVISVASRDANDLEDLFSGWILLRVLNLASSTIHWCRNYFKEFKKGVSNEQKWQPGGLMLLSCLHAARWIKPLFCQCALYLHVKNQPTAQPNERSWLNSHNHHFKMMIEGFDIPHQLCSLRNKYEVILFCVCVNGVDSEIIWVEGAPSRIIFTDLMLLYQSSKFLLANKDNPIDHFITVQWEFIIFLNLCVSTSPKPFGSQLNIFAK